MKLKFSCSYDASGSKGPPTTVVWISLIYIIDCSCVIKSSLATKSEISNFLNFIISNLDKKGFLQPDHKRRSMIRNINNIFHRLNLSEQEIRILLGIFSTLNEFNKKT